MSDSPDWPSSYVAASALLGEPADAIEACLGDCATEASTAVLAALRSGSRDVRAAALARVATAIAVAVERARLA
jgi:hypothetical protein